jgi:transcriptional regulator with XRE-family HTH domain
MEQTVNSRIALLRKELGKNQTEFAAGMGLTNAAISAIELGKAPLTEANIRLVSLVYGVNEEWIRYGTGEMFKKPLTSHDDDEIMLISLFRRLTFEMKQIVLQKVGQLLDLDGPWEWNPPGNEQPDGDDATGEKRA